MDMGSYRGAASQRFAGERTTDEPTPVRVRTKTYYRAKVQSTAK